MKLDPTQFPSSSKSMYCMDDIAKPSASPPWIWPSTIIGLIRTPQSSTASIRRTCQTPVSSSTSGVDGDFEAGDVVELVDPRGAVVARGIVGYDAAELPVLIGRSTRDLPAELRREVVHADDLVPL